MRLIDADALAKKAYDVAYPVVHGRNDHELGLTLMGIAQLLDEMPTVDAVPVIRCKDCKWYDMTDAGGTFEPIVYRCRRVSRLWREPHDFCSRAEKIED